MTPPQPSTHTNGRQWSTTNDVEVPCFVYCLPGAFASSVACLPEGPTILRFWFRAKGSASIAPHTEHAPDILVDASFANVLHPHYRPGSGGLQCPLQPPKKPHTISRRLQRSSFHPNKGIGHCCQWHTGLGSLPPRSLQVFFGPRKNGENGGNGGKWGETGENGGE